MKKQYLESGKIVTTHGVRGEVRVQPWCDTPGFLTQFACLYLDARGSQARVVERARVHKNIVIVKFEGVENVEDAAGLRGKTVYIDRADVELEEGECFVQDLIGCTVRDRRGLRADIRRARHRRQRRLLSARRCRPRTPCPGDCGRGARKGSRRRCNHDPSAGGIVR